MKNWDDEIYIALAHPIRRRIIECLLENNLSFSELLERVGVGNHGKLGFHMRVLEGLVEHEQSNKKYRLTERGQLAGELIWDFRLLIKRGRRDLAHEPTRYVRRLRLTDHAILYYDIEDSTHGITFPFLEAGLQRREAVIYVVSERKLKSESREIQRYGISDYFGKEAFTIMSSEEWYLKKGKAKAKKIMANWLTLAKEKQKAGFAGLRVAAEMEAFFNHAKSKDLLRYEAALGRQLPPNLCGLCLYDVYKLDEEQFIQLEKCHGHSILKGTAFRTPIPAER